MTIDAVGAKSLKIQCGKLTVEIQAYSFSDRDVVHIYPSEPVELSVSGPAVGFVVATDIRPDHVILKRDK